MHDVGNYTIFPCDSDTPLKWNCSQIPVLVEYFNTGLVPRFPSLIVAGFLLMIAVMTFMCGIILQVVVRKHREEFELFLNREHEKTEHNG